MGQISGTYTENYGGAEISFFTVGTTNAQTGDSLSGSGSWTYTIRYTDNGFTNISWKAADYYWTEAEVLALSNENRYRLATALNGSVQYWGCVDLIENK